MRKLGRIQANVLGLLTIHSGISSREIAEELERSETQISQVMLTLESMGMIDGTNQPTARAREPVVVSGEGRPSKRRS